MIVESPYASKLATISVSEHSVEVLGSATKYWVYGQADAATTVIVVHGFRGEHHGLEPVIAQLPEFRVIAPDLPAFGESTPFSERDHELSGYSDWLRAFVALVDPEGTAAILGHSFGSIIVSAALASGMPAPRVVLVNPIAAPALAGPRGILTRLAVFYYWLGAKLPARLGFAWLRSRAVTRIVSMSMAKTTDKSLLRWIHAQHDTYFGRFANRDTVLGAFRASVSSDVSEFASSIGVPTLLIAAERDDITPVAAQYELQKKFADAQLVIVPGVGHLIHYETPAEAAEAIRGFL